MARPSKYASAAERRRARNAQSAASKRRKREGAQKVFYFHEMPVRVPFEVRRERDAEHARRAAFNETPNHIVLGDPPPWRSALNQRGT